jgi:ketosteroid isomerase-like protein
MAPETEPRAEISASARRFLSLFAQDDIAGVACCYTEDAQMLPANMPDPWAHVQYESAEGRQPVLKRHG